MSGPGCHRPRSAGRLADYVLRRESAMVGRALRKHRGHVSLTAKWLGISRRSLLDKLREHGLDGEAAGLRAEAGIAGPRIADRRIES